MLQDQIRGVDEVNEHPADGQDHAEATDDEIGEDASHIIEHKEQVFCDVVVSLSSLGVTEDRQS